MQNFDTVYNHIHHFLFHSLSVSKQTHVALSSMHVHLTIFFSLYVASYHAKNIHAENFHSHELNPSP